MDAQFASATVTVRKSGKGQNKFLIFKFGEVSVISYEPDVKSETPEESLIFKFMTIGCNTTRNSRTARSTPRCARPTGISTGPTTKR